MLAASNVYRSMSITFVKHSVLQALPIVILLSASFRHGVHASSVLNARQSTLPSGWTSLGCYSDSTSSRTLRVASFTDVNDMTIESCLAFCTPSGYKYAGVEFSRECYCDNVIESPGAPISSSSCNMACTGNSAEICGGANAINIFTSATGSPTTTTSSTTTTTTTSSTTSTTAPVATPSIVQTAGTFQYKGCFQDAVLTTFRTLGTSVSVSGGVNAERCTAACKAAGFPLAGLEFGQECWCDTYMEIVSPAPDTDCNKVCVADATELCGAGNRLAVYEDTSATPPNPQTCLTNFQLSLLTLFLEWVPSTGGTASQLTGIVITGNDSIVSLTTVQNTVALTDNVNGDVKEFSLGSGAQSQDELSGVIHNLNVFVSALAPVVGGAQFFLSEPTGTTFVEPYNQYCPKPNPVSQFGPFIGPAVLSVNGHTDQWALCNNVTSTNTFGSRYVVYSPISTNPNYDISQCESIFVQLQIGF